MNLGMNMMPPFVASAMQEHGFELVAQVNGAAVQLTAVKKDENGVTQVTLSNPKEFAEFLQEKEKKKKAAKAGPAEKEFSPTKHLVERLARTYVPLGSSTGFRDLSIGEVIMTIVGREVNGSTPLKQPWKDTKAKLLASKDLDEFNKIVSEWAINDIVLASGELSRALNLLTEGLGKYQSNFRRFYGDEEEKKRGTAKSVSAKSADQDE